MVEDPESCEVRAHIQGRPLESVGKNHPCLDKNLSFLRENWHILLALGVQHNNDLIYVQYMVGNDHIKLTLTRA